MILFCLPRILRIREQVANVELQKRCISIIEYQKICVGNIDGVEIMEKDIQELKDYIDEQNMKEANGNSQFHEFLRPIRNGVQANNYVGVLQTKSGLTIEILPKIYDEKSINKEKVRSVFLRMLKTVRSIDGKKFNMTNLDTRKNNLLEIFISMFLYTSNSIIKKGIKHSYVRGQSNEKFLKGKLCMTEHLRKNAINQSYFYNELDEFSINIAENQLLKTTLEFLLTKSKDTGNLKIIREQLIYFDFVETTCCPNLTFPKVKLGRYYQYYEPALNWCMIFLARKSFTSFRGESSAIAILFPMEKIFEAYIATLVKQYLPGTKVFAQHKPYFLFDETIETKKEYNLRPDIVVEWKNKVFIADTKWKILDEKGPLSSDLYQMYAYHTRYEYNNKKVERVILIYPFSEKFSEKKYKSLDKRQDTPGENITAEIHVRFVKLMEEDIKSEISALF